MPFASGFAFGLLNSKRRAPSIPVPWRWTRKGLSALNDLCPYGIDIDRKLKIAHDKLSGDGYIF